MKQGSPQEQGKDPSSLDKSWGGIIAEPKITADEKLDGGKHVRSSSDSNVLKVNRVPLSNHFKNRE
jgi:hypothetical protein